MDEFSWVSVVLLQDLLTIEVEIGFEQSSAFLFKLFCCEGTLLIFMVSACVGHFINFHTVPVAFEIPVVPQML